MSEQRPAKAVIYRLKEARAGTAERPPTVAVDGDPIPVQFNPTTLKVERTNDTSGGSTTRAQRRNRPNEGHATLSLDLEYDTAEGGPDGEVLDVRVRTQDLRQFAEPPSGQPKEAPPRLRFVWGNFSFDGIVSRISEEIDYFAADGTALRAKISLTITGQDEAFESNATGPGARDDTGATAPGGGSSGPAGTGGGTGPGSGPTSTPNRAVDALDGESVQQALSRQGLDPATWRSAMAGLDSPLGLGVGVQLQVDASISAGAGLGVSAGFSAGVSAGASVGLSAGLSAAAGAGLAAGVTAGASAGFSAGGTVGASAQASASFALSAVGGVEAAAQGVLAARADAGVAAARGSFAVPGSVSASAGISASATTGGAARVDTRAVTYGSGVPLKPPATLR